MMNAKSVAYHTFVICFGLVMLYPILWLAASSLKDQSEIFTNPASLIPSRFVWENYAVGWRGVGTVGFNTFFANTTFITVMVVLGTLISSSLVAFGFARLQFKFRSALFAAMMVTMMLPAQVTLIPQYILFKNLGWINTYYPLIVPAFAASHAFFVFLMMQFYRGIPKELDEAAVIDGCSTFGIYARIIMPLSKSVLTTVSIFCFMWTWDDFFGPLIYLNSPKLYTVALGLRMFSSSENVSQWGPLLAMSTLSLVPLLVLFLVFQKYIIHGIATSGLKG